MIKRRDLLVAIISVSAMLGVVALAQTQKPIMQSSVFDWNSIAAKPTKGGARRDFFDSPTATLDQLECHVTTINQVKHPTRRISTRTRRSLSKGTIEAMQNG